MGLMLKAGAVVIAVTSFGCSEVAVDEASVDDAGIVDETPGELTQALDATCSFSFVDVKASYDAASGGSIYSFAQGACQDGSSLEYRVTAKTSKNKALTLSNWSPYTDSYNLAPGSAEGTYTVTIAARRAGTTATVASATRAVVVGRACNFAAFQASPGGASPGDPVTLKPSIGCPDGIEPEWRFTVSKPGGGSVTLPWLRDASTIWDTTGLNPGTATLTLAVRTFGNTAVDLTTKQTYVLGGVCTASTLGATGTGTSRTLTATSSCVGTGTAVYRFSSTAPDGSTTMLRDFDASPSFAWNVAGLNGSFTAKVEVRAAQSPTQPLSNKTAKVNLGDACTKLTLNSLWGTYSTNQQLVATATPNCGLAEVQFQRRAALATTWTTICDYSAATSCDVGLGSLPVGDYVVRALARKQGSIAAYDVVSTGSDFILTNGGPLLRSFSRSPNSLTGITNVSADGRWLAGGSTGLFRWSRVNGFTDLGTLPTTPQNVSISEQTTGISDNGAVVVGWCSGQYASEPFRWASNKMTSLTPDTRYTQIAASTNSTGSVVVGGMGSAAGEEAFRWTSAGILSLGDLPGGRVNSDASDVSGDGNVVVGRAEDAEGLRAFRWTAATGMVSLGVAPGDTYSSARSVSQNGATVVGQGNHQAIRWTAATGMVALGDLQAGAGTSFATGVSANGAKVVGAARVGPNEQQAFLWTPEAGLRRLSDVLAEQGVDMTDWSLDYASDISADGKTIVGSGSQGGYYVAWVLTLP